jgi:phosphoglycolate phosphatase
VRGVLFDLDGTLVDSYDAIAASLNHARAAWAHPPLAVAEVRRRVGHGLESLVAELVTATEVERAVALFRERYAACYAESTVALAGAAETLARLRARGLRLAVASNKPERFSRAILERLDLAVHLDCVVGPEAAGSHKPDAAMLHLCLSELGLAAHEALYVGDMVLDVESGARAGVPVALVRGGSSDDTELDATGLPVFDSLVGLADCLAGHTGS